jgi:hypothetical protein
MSFSKTSSSCFIYALLGHLRTFTPLLYGCGDLALLSGLTVSKFKLMCMIQTLPDGCIASPDQAARRLRAGPGSITGRSNGSRPGPDCVLVSQFGLMDPALLQQWGQATCGAICACSHPIVCCSRSCAHSTGDRLWAPALRCSRRRTTRPLCHQGEPPHPLPLRLLSRALQSRRACAQGHTPRTAA